VASDGVTIASLPVVFRPLSAAKTYELITEIIEEAPAPGLSSQLKKDLAEKAVAAAKAVN
jgi:hypothetical protein